MRRHGRIISEWVRVNGPLKVSLILSTAYLVAATLVLLVAPPQPDRIASSTRAGTTSASGTGGVVEHSAIMSADALQAEHTAIDADLRRAAAAINRLYKRYLSLSSRPEVKAAIAAKKAAAAAARLSAISSIAEDGGGSAEERAARGALKDAHDDALRQLQRLYDSAEDAKLKYERYFRGGV